MRHIAFLTFMGLLACSVQAQTQITSTIESVKVFTQGAEIYRKAQVNLVEGTQKIELTQLSGQLDPSTIQISAEGITILSVRHKIDFLDKKTPEAIENLWKKRHRLSDSIEVLNMQLAILKNEAEILNKNTKVIGSQGISGRDYQSAIEYFSTKLKTNAQHIFSTQKAIENLTGEVESITNQIAANSGTKERPTSKILLTIKSEKAQKTWLSISYSTLEAGWIPSYDIRAKSVNSPLQITYKAKVFQNSGVDWKNVKLTLSSGDIASTGTAPQLFPYYIGGQNHVPSGLADGDITGQVFDASDGLPLPQALVMVKGTTIGTTTDSNGFFSLQVPNGSSTLIVRFLGFTTREVQISDSPTKILLDPEELSLNEVVVTGYAAEQKQMKTGASAALQGNVAGIRVRGASSLTKKSDPIPINVINYETTFAYDIELPYDIPTSGIPETVEIQTKEIDAEYLYSTSPKIRANAYLVAQVANWQDLKLLDGESNLYFENSFVGKSIIDTNLGSDTLSLSLGKDEGIIVNRQRLKQFEKHKLFGNRKREERKYLITVVNTKQSIVSISIYDQIPLSALSSVKVRITNLTDGIYNEKTGLVSWKITLQPGEKREIEFAYEIDCPSHIKLSTDL
ncbi:mucoidy inhibitor MuiA family protein [Roseivirga sp. UBA838]|uniref:mucoidy inhibitor MuiA family protein n=1 Tax=Roseivirga sp. UBA838 TaxID=1947393 RepID=UPI00257D7537|nr:mucoidy inhibitor MuiA family protein [Roseivirga sp. UBA838]|tara:strand:+ start:24081 stop:25955 length:1875 start_codon:yes stop_codon:yes gene_type:complete